MSTLLLRFAAPIQSWGSDSKFERRYTGRAPTKSAVIGLCAAALGYRRGEDEKIAKLSRLKFGVRIDKPGILLKDFHMAHGETFWSSLDRSKINRDLKKNASFLTIRYYLSDAVFLAGLEGDGDFLNEIDAAIRTPMFPLYLGRRSCPPEGRVSLGIVPDDLCEALIKQPPVAQPHRSYFNTENKPRIVIDADRECGKDYYFMRDLPRSFNPEHRLYDFRRVNEFDIQLSASPVSSHDALGELEE